MDIQFFLVILLAAIATAYLGLRLYKSFSGKGKSGCADCGLEDLNKVESKKS